MRRVIEKLFLISYTEELNNMKDGETRKSIQKVFSYRQVFHYQITIRTFCMVE